MADLIFFGQFIDTKTGASGVAPTIDINRITIADGTDTIVVTGGSPSESRNGVYFYRLASASPNLYDYVATFKTASSSVDQQHLAALGLVLPDANISALPLAEDYTAVRAAKLDDILSAVGARTALGMASANLDTQLAALPTDQDVRDAMKLAPTAGTPATGSVDKHLDDLLTNTGGAGATSTVITITDGTNPLDGVEVWVTSDSAGSNIIAGVLSTDTNGQVTFMLDAGTVYVWSQLAGYNFTNPQTLVVS